MRILEIKMDEDVFEELKRVADKKGKTVEDLLKDEVKLILVLDKLEDDPNSDLIIRENDQERVLTLSAAPTS